MPAGGRSPHSGLLEAALAYAEAGRSVVPLEPRGKRPLANRSWQRHQSQHATPREIERWFAKDPTANLGIVTGAVSGVVGFDIDFRSGGKEGLTRLPFVLPETITTVSGNGLHFWYASKEPLPSRDRLLPGIEFKASGKYLVAPPSIHPTGRTYVAAGGTLASDTVPELPEEIAAFLRRNTPSPAMPTATVVRLDGREDPYVAGAVASALTRVRSAPMGSRNNILSREAFGLFGFVKAGYLDAAFVESELTTAACFCGLPLSEARATIRSALRAAPARLSKTIYRADVSDALSPIYAAVDASTWQRQSGRSDRTALEAILRAAAVRGSTTLSLASTYVATLAGVSQPTAWRALGRLERRGFLRCISRGRRGGSGVADAGIYELTPPPLNRILYSSSGKETEAVAS